MTPTLTHRDARNAVVTLAGTPSTDAWREYAHDEFDRDWAHAAWARLVVAVTTRNLVAATITDPVALSYLDAEVDEAAFVLVHGLSSYDACSLCIAAGSGHVWTRLYSTTHCRKHHEVVELRAVTA